MRRKIEDIADITIGYQHRGRPVSAGTVGSHRMVQIKDIDREGRFIDQFAVPAEHRLWLGSLYMVTPKGAAETYAVKEGDVLFLSRGSKYFAVPMVRPYVEPFPASWDGIIAAYYFYVLRTHRKDILPEFLAWSLNSERVQSELEAMSQGSHMTMVSKAVFAQLVIDVPSVATQKLIVELHHLALKERRLVEQIQQKRALVVESLCSRLASGQLQ